MTLEPRLERRPAWMDLQPMKNRIWIDHITPSDRQITEEIIVRNTSDEDIMDFPIPLPEFRHGLVVLDEDEARLSFYSREEIHTMIKEYSKDIQSTIEHQLDEGYLVWIRLPETRPIHINELRSIRLRYWGSGPSNPSKIKLSIFDIRQYLDYLGKGEEVQRETSYFIRAPKDCNLKIVKKYTQAYEIKSGKRLDISHEQIGTPNLKKPIVIMETAGCISVVLPAQALPYMFQLAYQVILPRLERAIWSTILLISATFVGLLIVFPTIPFISSIYSALSLSLESIAALAAIGGGAVTALIALINNPLIVRTRLYLLLLFFAILVLLVWHGHELVPRTT